MNAGRNWCKTITGWLLQHPRGGCKPESCCRGFGRPDWRLDGLRSAPFLLANPTEPSVTGMEGGQRACGWCPTGGACQATACTGTVSVGMKLCVPLLCILRARCWATESASWCRYQTMASECQRPNSFMTSVSTPLARRAMAPPAQRDLALTSEAASPVAAKHCVAAKRSCRAMSDALMRRRRPQW